jgi:hypothetical protein
MNDKIILILEDNGFDTSDFGQQFKQMLNSAIIEICEEQKIESANQVGNNSLSACVEVLNSKNIAK